VIEPFLKWPGGKRWLVRKYSGLFPSSYRRYLEPFLGGGSVFFHLMPRHALLTDTNPELINAYQCVKDDPSNIEKALSELHKRHSKSLYYRIRNSTPTEKTERAVRFLYLNRTCFNGIFRVNLRGEFNVPMGSKTAVQYPAQYLETIAACLQNATIRVADFEKSLNRASEGDFVFVDPPYTVMHNNNNFVKYNSSLFSWSDQLRLAGAIKSATRRGAAVLLSNADHNSVRTLYEGFGHHLRIKRCSILSGDAAHRRETTELLVMSYDHRTGNGEGHQDLA
jgi:DNA adenine methylase